MSDNWFWCGGSWANGPSRRIGRRGSGVRRAKRDRRLVLQPAAAEKLQQHNGFVVLIVGRREGAPRVLKFDDTAGELQPRARGKLVRFENGSPEELRDKLQLIAREPRQKAASLRFQWAFSTRGQSGNQDA